MVRISSKSSLAVVLSRLEGFSRPKVRQEQYSIDSEVAASVLWNAYLLGDIEGKVIVDLGCGTGILGIGALLLGAKNVYFVDSDQESLDTSKTNIRLANESLRKSKKSPKIDDSFMESESYKESKAIFMCKDVSQVSDIEADIVIQNPPFGTKIKHIDRIFLEKALEIAQIIYSFHKSETLEYLERFAVQKNTKITHRWSFKYPLKASYFFHRRKIHRIEVSCLRIETSSSSVK